MFSVHDWAEVHRLFHREQLSKSAIGKRLGMTRHTVARLLARAEPPRYRRARRRARSSIRSVCSGAAFRAASRS